uniref:Uncharacterized protein n=1 Tax=Amphimedon queenslandica TaxID=400682 RepID=A0A1X7UJL5_AMPQE
MSGCRAVTFPLPRECDQLRQYHAHANFSAHAQHTAAAQKSQVEVDNLLVATKRTYSEEQKKEEKKAKDEPETTDQIFICRKQDHSSYLVDSRSFLKSQLLTTWHSLK